MNEQILSAEKEQQRQSILKTIEEKGEMWMVAAMIHGSIGYHTPEHAKRIIARFRAGNTRDTCERCDACFRTDLLEMMDCDIQTFKRYWELAPEKAKNLISFTEKVCKLDSQHQETIGLLFPTMGI
ncbi:MAG: hypothetical protein SCH70_12970 [Candidatus Methanoperedens sp.]|nr:hypothetical protein [Candidatus Methanoperedens sp.]